MHTRTVTLFQGWQYIRLQFTETALRTQAAPSAVMHVRHLPTGERQSCHSRRALNAQWSTSKSVVNKGFDVFRISYSPFQKECPIWGPAAGDQLLLRPVICGADVRPRGCREIALVSLARAAWAVAMQSAHARALLPALPWQLM